MHDGKLRMEVGLFAEGETVFAANPERGYIPSLDDIKPVHADFSIASFELTPLFGCT
jgi:hypothetical protein